MSVILMSRLRAARQAKNLAESMSSDPAVRQRARLRALGEVMRRERQVRHPQLAEVVYLDTRIFELRKSLRRRRRDAQ